jgi:hypothetical protein
MRLERFRSLLTAISYTIKERISIILDRQIYSDDDYLPHITIIINSTRYFYQAIFAIHLLYFKKE